MKNKLKIILSVICLGVVGAGATACAESTLLDEYLQKGYTVSVTYDGNGGTFENTKGMYMVDMFKPTDYEKDGEGKVHIKLLEPTSEDRRKPGESNATIKLARANHFFVGWYQERTLVTNEAGQPVDDNGTVIEKIGETYYYPLAEGQTNRVEAYPAYDYDGYWNFETDTVEYSGTKPYAMTLYAAWLPYFEYEYYYRGEGGAWTSYGSTDFDYKMANSGQAQYADLDTIWLPDWSDGAMNHEYRYSNNTKYVFPKLQGKTFAKAYSDEDCLHEITDGSFEHQGSIDLATGKAVNPVQKIYVEFTEGEQFRISTPEQLVNYASPNGHYEILNDLDMSEKSWPNAFMFNEFTGKFASTAGNVFKIENVVANYSNTSATCGGLFGSVAAGAEIKDINFVNATLDYVTVGGKDLNDASFGFFSGTVAEGATVSGISLHGTLRLGAFGSGTYPVHLIANGENTGITDSGVGLVVYGSPRNDGQFRYTLNPTTVTVSAEGVISFTFEIGKYEQAQYVIK